MPKARSNRVRGICPVCGNSVNGSGRIYCEGCQPPLKIDGGYILIYQPDHPRANKGGYVPEHIVVMEQKMGRPVKRGEVVHHRDGDKHNNSSENLMLFPSSGKHVRFHALERKNRIRQLLTQIEPEEWGELWMASLELQTQEIKEKMLRDKGYQKEARYEIAKILGRGHYQLIVKHGFHGFAKLERDYKIAKEQFISFAMLKALEY